MAKRQRAMDSRDERQRLIALLGLAQRAGKLAAGISAVERSVARRQRPLVLLVSDAGGALRRRVARLEPVRDLRVMSVTRAELARALGRHDLAVVAIADTGFVRGITALSPSDRDPQRGNEPSAP